MEGFPVHEELTCADIYDAQDQAAPQDHQVMWRDARPTHSPVALERAADSKESSALAAAKRKASLRTATTHQA